MFNREEGGGGGADGASGFSAYWWGQRGSTRAKRLSVMVKSLMLLAAKKQPDNCDEILQAKAKLEKYLKEKCSSEHYQQLSFKYF